MTYDRIRSAAKWRKASIEEPILHGPQTNIRKARPPQLTFCLPLSMKRELEKRARDKGVSISRLVCSLLEKGLKAEGLK